MRAHRSDKTSHADRDRLFESRVKRRSGRKVRKCSAADHSLELTVRVERLRSDYADWKKGFHQRKYDLLQRAYSIAHRFERNEAAYEEFRRNGFWSASRQRPKKNNIDKWVLYYVMNATTKQIRDRAGKYAKVLSAFRAQRVPGNAVARRLAEAGGIERELKKLNRSTMGLASPGEEDSELQPGREKRSKPSPLLKVSMKAAMMDKILSAQKVRITASISSEGLATEARATAIKILF